MHLLREKISQRLIEKMLNLFPKNKIKYGIKKYDGKFCKYSMSQHKGKNGRQYALFCRVYFGKHKRV